MSVTYFIGGAPRSGKAMVIQKLAKREFAPRFILGTNYGIDQTYKKSVRTYTMKD